MPRDFKGAFPFIKPKETVPEGGVCVIPVVFVSSFTNIHQPMRFVSEPGVQNNIAVLCKTKEVVPPPQRLAPSSASIVYQSNKQEPGTCILVSCLQIDDARSYSGEGVTGYKHSRLN